MSESPAPNPIRRKVKAGTLTAGVGAGVGLVVAQPLTDLASELLCATSLCLSEAGLGGLYVAIVILTSAAGSFAGGWSTPEKESPAP